MTNGDRIRSMTDEELAGHIFLPCHLCPMHYLCHGDRNNCEDIIFHWLVSEVKE